MSKFEHLELPKTNIEYIRRLHGGGNSKKRHDRTSHGSKLLSQLSSLINRPEKKNLPFGINPKLIFKIKFRKDFHFPDENVIKSGLNLVAKEPKSKLAIIVFSSDDNFKTFQEKLKAYSGEIKNSPEYGYLDDIEDLVPLEPEDRIGRLLELEPLKTGELVPLDLELWHTGNNKEMTDYIDNLDEFLKTWQEYPDMKVTDKYIGEYICIARIKIRQEILDILLAEEVVKEIDRRPKPAFESPQEINIPVSEFPDVISPPLNNAGVLVIDSGVQGGHPLIKKTLGDTEVFPDPEGQFIKGNEDDGDQKTGGHGTGVSGIAIYGDINQCIQTKRFQPQVWLFSARVTNENNEYDSDLLLDNQLEKAVDYFVNNYPNCKVINISLGDDRLIYQHGQKQFRLAAKIDEIAYKYQRKNILFVISAGNFYYQPQSNEQLKQEYPNYLLDEKAKIIEPATAAIALTVGSLSMGKGSSNYPEDACRNAIAKVEGYPSPFTRVGFGVDGMIKPEFVDFGGDLVLERTKIIPNELGVSVITLNKNFQGNSLFKAYCGTSFSAPRVANLAAQLFTKFPNATSNLIRALIADSAQLPSEIPKFFQSKENKKNQLRIYGYGQPNFDKAAYSTENQVILLEDNQSIPIGKFQIYEIPTLPDSFLKTKGNRKISITLAFDPPTRHTRGDSYLGITMEFRLFRNIDKKTLQNAFLKANRNEKTENVTEMKMEDLKKKYGSNIEVDLFPNNDLRKKGTLQKGTISISKSNWKYNKKPLYIVVMCNRKWAKEDEIDVQRYALVASATHSDDQVDLYNHLKLQTRVSQRASIRR
ncbi:S8 family peptidase [Cyanobacterium aponinum AL20118]|uniref:S8 family peptidase n=1 Tax=Cyanobacterium aponinum AL20115 TaxID=3090662 RepID=A0AAF0ZC39_9CHRO|nr:S8 family peptidase [Cyanobacterium aponinum]WPF87207.1 S8 family peptidase [Cyanobacterium aponinum AL20115]